MGRILKWITFVGLAVALLIASGLVDVRVSVRDRVAGAIELFGGAEQPPAAAAEPFWKEGGSERPATPPGGAPSSFADLAERVSPAVVNIQTKKTLAASGRHPLEELFPPGFRFEIPRQYRDVPSLGTGFVISPDGFIATNNHVIEDVDKIVVHFLDGKKLEAEIVGHDPSTDVALIRVKPEQDLAFLPLGNSDGVRPGDWVLAVGNPFGLEHTVTAGIVSAKHREINQGTSRRFDDFLQTDAAINPGNSGGPLLNLSGEVIGINTAIRQDANTIGFAIPINLAKTVLPQLRASGKVSRGWLGVMIQPVTDKVAERLELESKQGALVSGIDPEGPAAKAGVRVYDVIVAFDGKPVTTMEELPKLVASAPVGSKARLTVIRKGEEETLTVQLGELDAEPKLASAEPEQKPGAFGLQVQTLTPEIAEQLQIEAEAGVVISGVEPGSVAEEEGLRRGDVILDVNTKPVASVEQFREALAESEGSVLLLVSRGGTDQIVTLERPKE